jgi:pantoate--beta-alanine ligase
MQFFSTPAKARSWCETQRQQGATLGMVPTMGALHDGHLNLVGRAVTENTLAVVSIFVNPLQFNAVDDYDAYPTDLQRDLHLLDKAGCAMVFTGTLANFFPEHASIDDIPMLDPGPLAAGLENDHRPGHFAGVVTIVDRLFDTVHPDLAYFGEKDFQQCLLVEALAKRKGYPAIVRCQTHRERSGLAMSSRNQRLSKSHRAEAAVIYRALLAAREAWQLGERHAAALDKIMRDVLVSAELNIEYAAVRDPQNWLADDPTKPLRNGRALIAVMLGGVRLIDNLSLDGSPAI